MAKYIDADKAIEVIINTPSMVGSKYDFDHNVLTALVDREHEIIDLVNNNVPTVDVAPVIHAHWERHFKRPGVYEDLWWHCSNCNGRTSEEYAPYWWSYCPYCGARMDGEVNDA